MKAVQRFLSRHWMYLPVIVVPVVHTLLLGAGGGEALSGESLRLVLAAVGAMLAGVLLTWLVARRQQRKVQKPVQRLAQAVRQATVNRRFDTPLVATAGFSNHELAEEINRLMRALTHDIAQLQQHNAELQSRAVEQAWALQQEVEAHKSAQAKLQSLARELDNRNRQLDYSLQQSQSADKAKAEFLANMSHEIRTPLNAVLGVASLLDRSPLNERQRQQLGMIFESGKSLLNILSDIMDYVRIEAGEITLDEFPFNLEELVLTIVNRHREEAMARGLHYQFDFSSALPRLYLGDGARLQQMLNNLLDNALKFTHEGSVAIRVSGVALQNRSYLLSIDVQDTGIGIADDVRDKLFKVFSQVDGSSTRAYGGSGLGLAITSRLVKLMQGTLTLQSEPGKGSLFRIEIPLNLYQDVVIDESALQMDLL